MAYRFRGKSFDLVRIECPHCGRDHVHGAGADGHRVGHCGMANPEGARLGYVLREVANGHDPDHPQQSGRATTRGGRQYGRRALPCGATTKSGGACRLPGTFDGERCRHHFCKPPEQMDEFGDPLPTIRIAPTDQVRRAAEASGQPLARWVDRTLNEAAEDTLALGRSEQARAEDDRPESPWA